VSPEGEISVDLAEDEWAAMMTDAEAGLLTAAARAAVASAAPHPGGIASRCFTCSVAVARELLVWCERSAARCTTDDPEGAAILERAARNLHFALLRVGQAHGPI